MRLKLIAKADPNGVVLGHNVKIVDAATGEQVEGIVSVSFNASVEDQPATMSLKVVFLEAEIEAEAEVVRAQRRGRGLVDATGLGDQHRTRVYLPS